MIKIMGIDVSSSTIGISVIEIDDNNNFKFISVDHFKPIKTGGMLDRLYSTRQKIKEIIEEIKPTHIGIEDIIQFMAGKSTAKTIITLTSFNRMIGLLAYDYLGHPPELFNVMSIRHGIKLSKPLPPKEDIPEIVAQRLNIKFPYLYKKNKPDQIKIESYDRADAIAVSLYYALKLTNQLPKKSKKK